MVKWVAPALVALGCGFPRPADVPDDIADQPQITIQVSTTGNDANDGITKPVLTLKRAVGIAMTRTEVVTITLEAGRYGMPNGELFPYTIQSHVTLAGPTGGGAILAGSTTLSGLIVESGTLRDLEFEDFTTAISVNGTAEITNIRVNTSDIAVRAGTTATLIVNGLDITGTSGSCSTGIELGENAVLTAADLTVRGVGTSILAKDHSSVKLSKATVTGDASCTTSMMQFSSNDSFILDDSSLDGGNVGITFQGDPTALARATLTDVTIRNTKMSALIGNDATVHMTGGEISNNQLDGIHIDGGDWTFTRVAITQNTAAGIYLQNADLTVRGCSISGNGTGAHAISSKRVDLGTDTDNGNNTIQNRILGLLIEQQQMIVQAVGNSWQPNVQGANENGRYNSSAVISGPIPLVQGNNYAILDQSIIVR